MVASSAQKETTGFPVRHAGSHRHPDELTTAAVNRSSAHGDDAARGGSHGAGATALVNASICDFGWKARDFALAGVDGKTYSLADVRGPKGTLVVFICNHCPYVRAIIDRLVETAHDLKGMGIGIIAIMPNDTKISPGDSFANMKAFAAEHKFPFPYVM